MERIEEEIKNKIGKIKVIIYRTLNVTRVSFEVLRQKWKKIERSPEWAKIKKMIEEEKSSFGKCIRQAGRRKRNKNAPFGNTNTEQGIVTTLTRLMRLQIEYIIFLL